MPPLRSAWKSVASSRSASTEGPGAFRSAGVPMNAAAAMASAMSRPNATPDPQGSTAEVSADVVMRTTAAARSSSS
jgi:hypothetical protein